MDVKNFAVMSNDKLENEILEFANTFPMINQTIRIMPDGHSGKGCTVGSVFTFDKYLNPASVGCDISCSVTAFNCGNIDIPLNEFDKAVRNNIPAGTNVREEMDSIYYDSDINKNINAMKHMNSEQKNRSMLSFGTLGGGRL